jgi:hypothetical protein
MRQALAEHAPGWICYHLYYHQDPDLAVRQLVRPLIARLLAEGWIDNYFFVRYRLGGPHIRLRLQARPASAESVAAVAEAAARSFLADRPSTSPLSADEVRRIHQIVLASEPHEHDDSIYPDNSFLAMPFRPEIERYGGPELLRHSLDFFTASSATVLDLLGLHGEQTRSRRAVAFQVLACQALSFARGPEDLAVLVRYAIDLWGGAMPRAIAQAERIFAEQKGLFDRLFRHQREQEAASLERSGDGEILPRLRAASRLLSRSIGAADLATHQRIGGSQLHMTANRLGLSNAEEVYLGRLLELAAAEPFP